MISNKRRFISNKIKLFAQKSFKIKEIATFRCCGVRIQEWVCNHEVCMPQKQTFYFSPLTKKPITLSFYPGNFPISVRKATVSPKMLVWLWPSLQRLLGVPATDMRREHSQTYQELKSDLFLRSLKTGGAPDLRRWNYTEGLTNFALRFSANEQEQKPYFPFFGGIKHKPITYPTARRHLASEESEAGKRSPPPPPKRSGRAGSEASEGLAGCRGTREVGRKVRQAPAFFQSDQELLRPR